MSWRESGGETVITARHAPPRETRPIVRSGATVTLQQPRASERGHLEYCSHAQAVTWERIVGCSIREPGDAEWRDVNYGAEGIPEVVTNLRTTATVIIILGGLVRRRQHPAGRGPGPPDGAVQTGVDPSCRHPHHPPERPGGAGRAQQRGASRHCPLGQGGWRTGIVEGRGRQLGAVHPGAAGNRSSGGTALGKGAYAEGRHRGPAAPLGGQCSSPYAESRADPRHHRVRRRHLPQPTGSPVGGVLRPARDRLEVRAGAVRWLGARFPSRAGGRSRPMRRSSR